MNWSFAIKLMSIHDTYAPITWKHIHFIEGSQESSDEFKI